MIMLYSDQHSRYNCMNHKEDPFIMGIIQNYILRWLSNQRSYLKNMDFIFNMTWRDFGFF